MIVDFFKYDLYRKYQTSNGVDYTPLDEYTCILKNDEINTDCGEIYSGSIVFYDTNNGNYNTLINKKECISYYWVKSSDVFNKVSGTGPLSVFMGNYDGLEYMFIQNTLQTDWSNLFEYCDNISSVNLSGFNASNITDMSYMFNGNRGISYQSRSKFKSINLSNLNTSNVTTMESMFDGCEQLENLDMTNINTSSVANMDYMFRNCHNLTSLDLSSFNTSNVIRMDGMFDGCTKLTSLNVSNFDTINVTEMYDMFSDCQNLTSIDLSNFNTSNVIRMEYMFYYCKSLTSIDLSNFDTSNVTNMRSMFLSCNSLNHIRCKQAFKDWCLTNQDTIRLPSAMREGGSGTWEIVP